MFQGDHKSLLALLVTRYTLRMDAFIHTDKIFDFILTQRCKMCDIAMAIPLCNSAKMCNSNHN